MKDFTPNTPYNVPVILQIPRKTTVKGVTKKEWPENGEMIFISFKTFGGTEITSNNSLSIENTGIVETWYRPDIKSDCRLIIDGTSYEILGTPENINMRNQYLQFKVRAVKGGA